MKGMAVYLPALTLSMFMVAPALALKAGTLDARAPVAVVFGPGTPLSEAVGRVVAAGGLPLRSGAFGNIVVAQPDDEGFAADMYRRGAWLLLDPRFAGCAAES